MSGWHLTDRVPRPHGNNQYRQGFNNITNVGALPSDMNPTGTPSRTLTQAHMRGLRFYRQFCRMVPFIVHSYALRAHCTEESAKLHLARYWRNNKKVRDPATVDFLITEMHEKLLNILQQDVWGGHVVSLLCYKSDHHIMRNEGYSYLEEAKYGKKSDFMKNFYTGGGKNAF